MRTILVLLFGSSRSEICRSGLNIVLVIAVFATGMELKRVSKSPRPREWNAYSTRANAYLYRNRTAPPRPDAIIAHAGGSLSAAVQANTLEALEQSYAGGLRLFEFDFGWTADGELVASHDWDAFRAGGKNRPPTLEEFRNLQSPGHTPMSIWDVCDWLEQHPDAYIITDIKKQSLEGLATIRMERPAIVPQIIPQIYLMQDYELARSQGYHNIILTLYRCLSGVSDEKIVNFVNTHSLFALTIPHRRHVDSRLAEKVAALGTPVYVHTVNDVKRISELIEGGVHGVYTDLSPNEIAQLDVGLLPR